jgi:hypothetical protein
MAPQRTRRSKKRRSPRATMIWAVTGCLLVATVLNVLVIHHQMPDDARHSGIIPFSALAKQMTLRHQQKRGIVEHQVLDRLQRLLQARWDLQHYPQQVTTEEKKDAVNVATELNQQNTTFREEDNEEDAWISTKDQQPNLGFLYQQGNMSSHLLDALKQYNVTYYDNKTRKTTSCMVPVDTTATACTETDYTVLAVVAAKNPSLRRLFLNVLRWLSDPAVTDIRIVLPASASGLLQRDAIYGARLSAWHLRHRVRLLFVASEASNLWEAVSKDAPIKTRAVVWRDGNEKLSQKHPSVSTTTDMAAGLTLWKQTPTALVAWASIHVENANRTLPHWNGLFHDRDWLCLLANEPFRTLVWDNNDWEYALQAMVLFLGHLSTSLQYYSTSARSSSAVSLEAVAALFGGYPLPEEHPVASRTCG